MHQVVFTIPGLYIPIYGFGLMLFFAFLACTWLSARLARAKAAAVGTDQPDNWVIGSDQAAELDDGRILGKPGTREAAIAQLREMSGRAVRFRTAVCLLRGEDVCLQALDTTTVRFRDLGNDEIERYVDAEQPLDCAGSFKSEGLGIALADREHVFERFYRSKESRSMPGSGLGLSIVRQVVERHSGHVRVDENDQGGTRMVLQVPGAPLVAHS